MRSRPHPRCTESIAAVRLRRTEPRAAARRAAGQRAERPARGWTQSLQRLAATAGLSAGRLCGALLWGALLWGAVAFTTVEAEAADPERVLRIATEGAYPPFNYVDDDGALAGFDVDIAWALCAVIEVDCVLVAEPWNSIIDGLVEQRYDAIVASMSVTEERKRQVAFTDKYYSTPMRFVAKRDSFLRMEEVTEQAIGAQAETTSFDYLQDGHPFGENLHAFETMEEAYAALLAGEVAAVLTDSLVAWDFLKSDPGQAFSFVGDPIYTDTEIAIAVRKEDEALRQDINRAITLLIIDGTYQEINQKYFPFSIY